MSGHVQPLTREKLEESAAAFEEMGYVVHVTGQFLRQLVASAKQGVETAENYDLLRRAINEFDVDGCVRECSSYGHADECSSGDPRAIIEKQQREINELRAAAVERGVRETPDTEQLLRFAGQALSECHIEFVGDWDGGSLQEAMLDCGLLEQIERAVPCGGECACSEAVKAGETTRCCVTTPLGDRAWAAYNDARKQIGRATRSGRRDTEKA